jgi:exopolyphosphatase/pppGpp-phosphohydrolase
MGDKSGDVPLVTLSQTIESVSNATSVTIRKNPLDKEEQTYKEALAEAEDEAAATAARECLAEVEKKRAEQLAEEKAKTILWLESLSDDLDHTMVVAVRNLCTLDGQMRKPVWCTGLSGGEEYVWDIGSGKIVLVSTKTGCQFGDYLEFDFDELTKEKIRELVEKMVDSQGMTQGTQGTQGTQEMTKVPAFATGKWRGDEAKFVILQKVMTEAGLTCELLTPEKEAFFGSRSTLGLMFPYFPQARNILTIELGGGSTQYMFFKRQQ